MNEFNSNQECAERLRAALADSFSVLLRNDGERIRHAQLICMPNSESLAALGDAASHFRGGDKEPDGDAWLAAADDFSQEELAAALAAGGKVVGGYEFWYLRSAAWAGVTGGWSGLNGIEWGYALSREVAISVCAASSAAWMAEKLTCDITERIYPTRLLWMPDDDPSLKVLGEGARHFRDDGDYPGGDLWLAPASRFSPDELAAAVRAGGKVVDGYEFPYPDLVIIICDLPLIVEAGKVPFGGWCTYHSADIGYALRREVAIAVCAASFARAKKEGRA